MQQIELLQPRAMNLLKSAISTDLSCLVLQGEEASGKTTLLKHIEAVHQGRCISLKVMPGSFKEQSILLTAAIVQLRDLLANAGAEQTLLQKLLAFELAGAAPDTVVVTAREIADLVRGAVPDLGPVWLLIDDIDRLHEDLLSVLHYLIAYTAHRPGGIVCTATQPVPSLSAYPFIMLEPITAEAVSAWVQGQTGLQVSEKVAGQLHRWSNGRTEILTELCVELPPDVLEGRRRLTAPFPGKATARYAGKCLQGLDVCEQDLLRLLAIVGSLNLPAFKKTARALGADPNELLADRLVQSDGALVSLADGVVARWLTRDGDPYVAASCERVLQSAVDHLTFEEQMLVLSWTSRKLPEEAAFLSEAALTAALRGNCDRAEALVAAMGRKVDPEAYPQLAVARAAVTFLEGYLRDAADFAREDFTRLSPSSDRVLLSSIYTLAQAGLGHELEAGMLVNELKTESAELSGMVFRIGLQTALVALHQGHVQIARTVAEMVEGKASDTLLSAPSWQYLRARLEPATTLSGLRILLDEWLQDVGLAPLPPELCLELAFKADSFVAVPRLRTELARRSAPIHRAFVRLLLASAEAENGDAEHAAMSLGELSRLYAEGAFAPAARTIVALKTAALQGHGADSWGQQAIQYVQRQRSHQASFRMYTARVASLLAAGEDWSEAEKLLEPMLLAASHAEDLRVSGLGEVDCELVGPVFIMGMLLRQEKEMHARSFYLERVRGVAGRSAYADAAIRFGMALGLDREEGAQVEESWLAAFPLWARPAVRRLLRELRALSHSKSRYAPPVESQDAGATTLGLDSRETEVARRILAGKRNKDIAADLFLSVRSVEAAVTRLFRKTGTSSRAGLAAVLFQMQANAGQVPHLSHHSGEGGRETPLYKGAR